MKRLIVFAMLIVIVCMCCACGSDKDQITIAGVPVSREGVNRFSAGFAEVNGDTYCQRCDKIIEGKVRVCPYCGKYI